jgi:predicted HTH domain antitoxin
MESIQRISKTDLARRTHQVIREVQRGYTAVVESHGEPEAAIIDILDYAIIRAVLRYYAQPPAIDPADGLADAAIAGLADLQERFNLVMAHYLAGAISLGRAAELLGLAWLELRTRFLRLDIPLRVAPADVEEARDDINAAAAWISRST